MQQARDAAVAVERARAREEAKQKRAAEAAAAIAAEKETEEKEVVSADGAAAGGPEGPADGGGAEGAEREAEAAADKESSGEGQVASGVGKTGEEEGGAAASGVEGAESGPAASASAGGGEGEGGEGEDEEQEGPPVEHPSPLPLQPDAMLLGHAQRLLRGVSECLRSTVKPDTIMVLPALPFPSPKRGASDVEKAVFAKLARCFNVLPMLGGCPSVTVPIGSLRDGSPVAISLMGMHKWVPWFQI